MRKLIEFLFGGIIEEIALARADQIIEQIVEEHVGNMQRELEDRIESSANKLYGDMGRQIDELSGRIDDVESEVSATKEEIDDMKGAA
tara:strand:+ start:351 stop:614 length:264 start_codon:yes stop_codon:yes gene_type:complete